MLYDGKPTHITEVHSNMKVIHKPLDEGSYKEGDMELLETEQLPIGYAFDERSTNSYYFERIPSRSFRQGLSTNNVRVKGDENGRHGIGLRDVRTPELLRMFMSNYRSIEGSQEVAKSGRGEVPFHRAMTIDWNDIVRWKTQVVGEYTNNSIRLMSRFIYLRETITEEGYNVS